MTNTMTDWVSELGNIAPDLVSLVNANDAGAKLIEILPAKYSLDDLDDHAGLVWEYAGLALQWRRRVHEALLIHWEHYQTLLRRQLKFKTRVHKGTPLVRISDCFRLLQFPVHEKRYLMLTLCEDAIQDRGIVSPHATGVYFRLVWGGLAKDKLNTYANQFFRLSKEYPDEALFPEALLQRLSDDDWITELPSSQEALLYRANPIYVSHLLAKLGDRSGETLEFLAHYLMSCMPGCRAKTRRRSGSSDYDVVCAMEGFDVDFRSELGRSFVCECKDWEKPADFTVMAKFCRVLGSTKSKFGILFSKTGITGLGRRRDTELEQLKFFQESGVIIVVLILEDLERIADGANLIALLRNAYEAIRLDLQVKGGPP